MPENQPSDPIIPTASGPPDGNGALGSSSGAATESLRDEQAFCNILLKLSTDRPAEDQRQAFTVIIGYAESDHAALADCVEQIGKKIARLMGGGDPPSGYMPARNVLFMAMLTLAAISEYGSPAKLFSDETRADLFSALVGIPGDFSFAARKLGEEVSVNFAPSRTV